MNPHRDEMAAPTLPPEFLTPNDLSACLGNLLVVLGWPGSTEDLLAALPPGHAALDLAALRTVLGRLGYGSRVERLRRGRLDARRLPALLLRPGAPAALLYHDELGTLLCVDGGSGTVAAAKPATLSGLLLTVEPASATDPSPRNPAGVGQSLAASLCGLALPLLAMALCDTLPAGQVRVLPGVLLAAGAALLLEGGLRMARRGALRRQDDAAWLELPGVAMAAGLLALIGGEAAVLPLAVLPGFALLHLALRGPLRRAGQAVAAADAARDSMASEAVGAADTLRRAAADESWANRHAEAAAAAAQAEARLATLRGGAGAISQALVSLVLLLAMVGGGAAAMAGTLTTGALLACLLLAWRVADPARLLVQSLAERQPDIPGPVLPASDGARMVAPRQGRFRLQHVTFRAAARAAPVLAGATLEIRAGEVVAVTGPEGAGTSALLRLLAGLHDVEDGAVTLDGHDLRAFDRDVLGRATGYLPPAPVLARGTVAEALRLAHPTAPDALLREAAREAGALAGVDALPRGFATRTTQVAPELARRLALARALLRDPPVLLLDELAEHGAALLARIVAARRGRTTIILATRDPALLRLADRVLRLEDGRLAEQPRATEQAGSPARSRVGVPA